MSKKILFQLTPEQIRVAGLKQLVKKYLETKDVETLLYIIRDADFSGVDECKELLWEFVLKNARSELGKKNKLALARELADMYHRSAVKEFEKRKSSRVNFSKTARIVEKYTGISANTIKKYLQDKYQDERSHDDGGHKS